MSSLLRWCGKADRADGAPFPGPFGAALDDEAKRAYVDVASEKMRAERVNDGPGGLARGAVADRDVRSPARGLAIRCLRPVREGARRNTIDELS
jgi:hypothetical protein